MPVKSTRQAALLLLAAATGCSAEDEVVLTVAGDAPGAVVLFARVVNDDGAPPRVYSAGDAEKPVVLPATIYIRLSHSKHAGVVVWLADAGGTIVAQAYSDRCAELAGHGKYTIMLSAAPDGWSPSFADRCRCDPADPLGPMCPPGNADGGAPADGGGPGDDGGAPDAEPMSDAGVDLASDALPPDSGADIADDVAPDAPRDAPADAARDAARDTRDVGADRPPDVRASPDLPPPTSASAIFGFEMTAPDWTSTDTALVRDPQVHTEGAASLSFTTPGTTTLRSRSFSTKGLGVMGTAISVDLFVNEKQVGDANTEMWVDCESAGVFGVYMGYKALAALKAPAWTSLTYKMPGSVLQAFGGDFDDCQISFSLVGKGLFRYDRMDFAP